MRASPQDYVTISETATDKNREEGWEGENDRKKI